MPTFRANITDRQQDVIENAAFEGGAAVFEDSKTRVVARGAQTGTQRTAHASGSIRSGAGVIMTHDDKPGKFVEATQGKRE